MAYEPVADFLKSKKKEGEVQEAADIRSVSNERSAMVGASALLMGLIKGNTGDAAEIASKHLLQEDQRAAGQQTSLMDHLRKQDVAKAKLKETGGKKRYQAVGVEKADGTIGLETFDTFTGKMADTDKLKGFSRKTVKNERTGDRELFSGSTGKLTKLGDEEKDTITPVFKKERDARYAKLNTRVKPDLDILRNSESGQQLLKTKGVMPTAVALNMVVKITEGRATDEDFERVIKGVGSLNRIRESLIEEKNGEVVKRKKQEAAKIFGMLNDIARTSIESDINKSAESISDTPEQRTEAIKNFSDLIPDRANSVTGDAKAEARVKRIKELKSRLGK